MNVVYKAHKITSFKFAFEHITEIAYFAFCYLSANEDKKWLTSGALVHNCSSCKDFWLCRYYIEMRYIPFIADEYECVVILG